MQENMLYQKIQSFALDYPDTCFTFKQRLARDNNWSIHYAERVIAEYKKFAFLAVVAGHKVTPSDQVDQAWHQHLLDSRSYWEVFCPEVLSNPLHHEPSRGGEAEQVKFVAWYQKTLDSYERLFGYAPPADIWPAAEIRFSRDLNFVRINTKQQWLIPKPKWSWPMWQRLSIFPLLLLIMVISGCAVVSPLLTLGTTTAGQFLIFNDFLSMNPEVFLAAYLFTGLILVLLANGLKRYWLRTFEPANPFNDNHLSTESLAYLSGGSDRVIHTALVALIERGNIKISEDKQDLELVADSHFNTPIEQTIIEELKIYLDSKLAITALYEYASRYTEIYKDILSDQGLLINDRQVSKVSTNITLLFTPLFLIGAVRLFHGMSVGHPVGFLFILLIIVGFTPLFFKIHLDKRTAYGEKVLATYQTAPQKSSLSAAVAISGLSALYGTALAAEREALIKTRNTADGGGCGGGSGCGGGCGGCGGCGG